MSDTKEIEVLKAHPLEDTFDIETGSTVSTKLERTTDLVESETIEYDNKDTEIEEQIQEVYDAAMGAFEQQMEESELVEGKYKARNGEVAVQFLNAALNAVKEKSGQKQHKDKVAISKGKLGPNKVENNIIVADRNDILRNIARGLDDSIDAEDAPKVINPSEVDEIGSQEES